MLCPKCRVTVLGSAKVCPLCHGALPQDEKQSDTQKYFPEYNRNTPLSNPIFDKIYLWFATLAAIACVVVNALTHDGITWSPFAVVLLYYGYFLIRKTLMDAKNFSIKFLSQVFLVTLVLAGVQIAIQPNYVVAAFIVPALSVLADVAMVLYMLKMWKNPRQYLMPFLSLLIFSATPVAFLFAFGIKEWHYALICAGISLIIFAISVTAYRKLLWRELRRFFHI